MTSYVTLLASKTLEVERAEEETKEFSGRLDARRVRVHVLELNEHTFCQVCREGSSSLAGERAPN